MPSVTSAHRLHNRDQPSTEKHVHDQFFVGIHYRKLLHDYKSATEHTHQSALARQKVQQTLTEAIMSCLDNEEMKSILDPIKALMIMTIKVHEENIARSANAWNCIISYKEQYGTGLSEDGITVQE